MNEMLTLEFDGGSRGNPGPAGIGVVLRAADGTALLTLGRFLGRATNNVAEYNAMIIGMRKALELGARRLSVHGDSELIIKQMRGEYRVRHPDLKPLHMQAQDLQRQFEEIRFSHNLRHHNELADRLANRAMDLRGEVLEVDEGPRATPRHAAATSAASAPPAQTGTAQAPQPGELFTCARCGCIIELKRPPRQREFWGSFHCVCGSAMS
jgi:ribonuclease HI